MTMMVGPADVILRGDTNIDSIELSLEKYLELK